MTVEDRDTQSRAIDTQLARVEGSVSEMSHGLSRLTWAVNIWGSVMTILVGIVLATMKH